MANATPPRSMSLIPYATDSRDVVLRRGNAIVVYDAQSRQLSVRDASEQSLDLTECPYCHRPYRDDVGHDTPESHRPSARQYAHDQQQRPFMDPDYFAMLAASQRPTPEPSGTSTPTRRFFAPAALRSGRSREVSGSSTRAPEAGAEFVGSAPAETQSEGISQSAFSPHYFENFFTERGILGRGGHGVVMLVEHVLDRVSLGQYACKRIPVGNDHKWLEKVLIEVKLLQKIPHSNLCGYHFVWLQDHRPNRFGPSIPCLWILQEYCNGGDLLNFVAGPREEEVDMAEKLKQKMRRKSKGEADDLSEVRGPSRLTFDQIFSFFRDITSGLHHLHTKGYIHRDLKPSNCLLQKDEQGKIVVKISDFGEVQAAGANRGSTGATGTISYCAPEVLMRDTPGGTFGNFTTKSDIFSLGMIVYFMCFGRLPYSNADDVNEENEDLDLLRAEILKWQGFDDGTRTRHDLPEKLYRYLRRLLSVDPNERPSTEDILNSIRGEVTLGEGGSPHVEPSSPRVLSADTPTSRPLVQPRRTSTYVGRKTPPFPSKTRTTSSRSRSPIKNGSDSTRQSPDGRESPGHASMVVRPRKIELPPSRDTPEPQQSPRLMLPPASETRRQRVVRYLRRPSSILGLRIALFVLKVVALLTPCSPYAASAWLLYPLLGLAALDVGVLQFDFRQSMLLFGVHFVSVFVAHQHGRLCERPTVLWEGSI